MSDFKAKMHNSISAGAPQHTPLGELTALQSLDPGRLRHVNDGANAP